MSITNNQSTLRNIPEEQKSSLHRSGSLTLSSVLLLPRTHLLICVLRPDRQEIRYK
jgi:hypothetical protein